MAFLIVIAIIELLVIVAGILYWKRTISRQQVLVDNAALLIKGKLDIDDIPISGKGDNTEVIAAGFNSIKTNLLTFVETTKQNVVVLSDAVDMLTNSMRANQTGNEQIANNTMEVDEKTIRQLELVQENLSVVEENAVSMEEAIKQMEIITDMLKETASVSSSGMGNLEGYAKDMEIVSDDLNAINITLTDFNDDIKKVSEVGDFIIGISNQLKLLSFNASIEAARAGQAGKGFAVVADEMTGMSEKTKEGMDRISSILSGITESSASVAQSIAKCTDTYNKSKETFEEVNTSFRAINAHATDIQGKIVDINRMFGVIASNAEKSKDVAENLHDTARNISEKTSEIASVSQEVTAESLQIGSNTEALSDMVDSIRKMLKRFDTGMVPSEQGKGKSVKIALIAMADNEFWYGVRRGANYAAKELKELGSKVEFIPLFAKSGEDMDELAVAAVLRLIEEKYDGIIYPGFLGGVEHLLKRAKSEGIKLMAYNCDCENKMLREAVLYSDSIVQGEVAGKAAAKLINKSGNVGILMGKPNVLGNVQRNKGFRDALKEYGDINIVDEVLIEDLGEDVYNKTVEWLKRDKSIKILFVTNGFLVDTARAIADIGMKGQTQAIGFDINPEQIPFIKSGIIGTVINQDSFGQGHDPIIHMYNNIAAGIPYVSEYISARSSIVDIANVNDLI